MSKDLLNSIISEIENKIDSVELNPQVGNVGEVFYLWDGVAKVSGLWEVSYNEVVDFESGAKGIALNLEEDYVGANQLANNAIKKNPFNAFFSNNCPL